MATEKLENVLTDNNVPQIRRKLYFLSARQFKGKKDPNAVYKMVEVIELDKDGKASVKQFFMDSLPEICDQLSFGDLIECVFDLSSIDRPQLMSITRLVKKFAA